MTAKSGVTPPLSEVTLDDDAPDLSTPYWVERFSKVKPSRGRPALPRTKVSTTLRLDPDVLDAYRATGPGWQSRINADLRRVLGL
jgi:uncharacterized protein (DUF4415 family)